MEQLEQLSEPVQTGAEFEPEMAPADSGAVEPQALAEESEAEALPSGDGLESIQAQYKATPEHLKDPVVAKILKDLAAATKRNRDKDQHINELKSKQKDLSFDDLFEAEASQQEEQKFPPAVSQDRQEQAKAAPPPPPPAQGFGDIGDRWQAPDDAYQEQLAAYQNQQWTKLDQINRAIARRHFTQEFAPQIRDYVQQFVNGALKENLGKIAPEVDSIRQERQETSAAQWVLNQITAKGDSRSALITEMLKPEGAPINVNGQLVSNNALQRILRTHPEIGRIRPENRSEGALRRAVADQYLMAMKIYQLEKRTAAPEAGQKLIERGKQLARQESRDEARQTSNAGRPRTPAAGSGDSNPYARPALTMADL